MKVLWFEVTVPSRYRNEGSVIGGWQDSLESIVRSCPEIELSVAFESQEDTSRIVDGVAYYPIKLNCSKREKRKTSSFWEIKSKKLLPKLKELIEIVCPDVIHVFGTEWPFGLVAELTEVPVVIHIQGSIVFYNNALYPPGYSLMKEVRCFWRHPTKLRSTVRSWKQAKSREIVENKVWDCVTNYMGRTRWDEAMSSVMHPNRNYYHVDEALRDSFLNVKRQWQVKGRETIILFSTGCSTFWKGPDLLLKTARILTQLKIDFKWLVAGLMPGRLRQYVEWNEKVTFEQCNVKLIGFVEPERLTELLLESTLYVHTAYVENSPNSICEAQILGLPVVSTNVGGISTLVRDRVDGILVPANDPWQMAFEIIELSNDLDRMSMYSRNSRERAEKRHNPDNIKEQLLNCYGQLMK